MKYSYIICIAFILLSCTGKVKETASEPVIILSKLEQLRLLPKDSVISYYDLSNDSLTYLPDLSEYTIKSLNLSYNLIDTLIISHLPNQIEKLDISYNLLKNMLRFAFKNDKYEDQYSLKELNISHNNLNAIDIGIPLYKTIASHNNLRYIAFNHKNIQYLDISFNQNLSNKVSFRPSLIDTVIRDGIANDDPLIDKYELLMRTPVD